LLSSDTTTTLGVVVNDTLSSGQALPAVDDGGMATVLAGLLRATGARGCRLDLALRPHGPSAQYVVGTTTGTSELSLRLDTESITALCQLFPAGSGSHPKQQELESLRLLLASALHALVERARAVTLAHAFQAVLAAGSQAWVVLDATGAVVLASPGLTALLPELWLLNRGEWDNRRPALAGLESLRQEFFSMSRNGHQLRHRLMVNIKGEKWRVMLTSIADHSVGSCCVATLTQVRWPNRDEVHTRLAEFGISLRQAEVLSLILRGARVTDIARKLGITEYTVKDHIKHAYARLGVSSRAQLLARLALTAPGIL
jgi:DNA-binding CsgD family transcriptional regulator